MRIKVPFGLQSYESSTANDQECINFYTEAQPDDSKNKLVVFSYPGAPLYLTVGSGPIHGMRVFDGKMYVVSGTELYSVSLGSSALLGTISGNKRVDMDDNGDEICIVNGSVGYVYDTTNGIRQITDDAFYPSERVSYLERRFLFGRKGTRQVFASNAFDGFTYDALNFDQTLTDPGDIITQIADHGELWLFGEKGTEVWVYNRNEAGFPYARLDGAFVEQGCIAIHSPAKLDNSFYWLGDDRQVYRADGYKPTRVSTHALEKAFNNYDTVSDAFGLTYEFSGHSFYELTFPTEDVTWRYDASVGLWVQAREGNSGRYHANANAVFEGKNLIGDYRNGNIYELNDDSYTNNGATIHRIASTPMIHAGRAKSVLDRLYLDMEVGVGLTTGQGSDPQIMLKYSKDGGKTWSNEKWKTLGGVGEYATLVEFDSMGQFYQIMFKLEVSDPVRVTIIDAYADIETDDSY